MAVTVVAQWGALSRLKRENAVLRHKAPHPVTAAAPPSLGRTEPIAAELAINDASADQAIQTVRRWNAIHNRPSTRELLEAIDALRPSDCREALKQFKDARGEMRNLFQRAISRRWASVDLEGATAALPSLGGSDTMLVLADECGRELTRRDPEAAMAWALETHNVVEQLTRRRSVARALADTDPARAAAFIQDVPLLAMDRGLFSLVAGKWAETAPQDAIAWAETLRNASLRREATGRAWIVWALRAPETVASFARKHSALQPEIFAAIAQSWSKTDPKATLAWINSLSSGELRGAAFDGFRIDEAITVADAVELVTSIGSAERGNSVIERLLRDLVDMDLAKARTVVESLPYGPSRDAALSPVIERWVWNEPLRAAEYVMQLPAGHARTKLIGQVMSTWPHLEPDASIAWAKQSLSADERYRAAINAIQSFAFRTGPEKSTEWLGLIEESETRREAIHNITESWAREDGTAASQWLNALPDSDKDAVGYFNVARQWTFADPAAAATWLGSLPENAYRDEAISGFVLSIDGYNPEAATEWANAIREPSKRSEHLKSAFSRWLDKDAAGASAWLHTATLNDELRAALNRAIARRESQQQPSAIHRR